MSTPSFSLFQNFQLLFLNSGLLLGACRMGDEIDTRKNQKNG